MTAVTPIADGLRNGIRLHGAPQNERRGDARGCIEIIKRNMPPGVYATAVTFLLSPFGVAWANTRD